MGSLVTSKGEYPIHSPQEFELLPGVGVSGELQEATADAVLDVQPHLANLGMDTHVTEEGEPDRLVLAGNSLGRGLDARAPHPARKLLGA